MASIANREQESAAFILWINTFELSKQVTSLGDLSDGVALFDVLSFVDPEYFRQPTRPSAQPSDNIGLQILALQRLYRLVNQYFTDVLRRPTSALEVPDLHAIAKERNVPETLRLCRLIIAIAVQTEKKKDAIEKIQGLREADQAALMRALEQVMSKFTPAAPDESTADDDHYYQLQVERSRLYSEKETLEKVYQALIEEHRTLQSTLDDTTSEKDDALSRLQDLRRELDDRRSEKADGFLRAEIDRLRGELQKSEDNLNMSENELEKQTTMAADLTRKNEELQVKANEAVRLKDQVDEYRHAADKLQKTENVMEKYKKKLEESADLRRTVKALEEQNASLVDRNAALEQENQKVSGFKPLMESYRTQVAELESKGASKQKETEGLKFELLQAQTRLKITLEERAKDSEALELYQERVRELEMLSTTRPTTHVKSPTTDSETDTTLLDSPNLESQDIKKRTRVDVDVMDGDAGLGGELEDAMTGRTMTDLKLQVRQLQRELEAAKTNSTDASRVMVLENLLEDANRMKARYESDYLSEHREKLVLSKELEEIRAGKTSGNGAEVAIALRQRLNETVDQLTALQTSKAELEVENETLNKALVIAKSDLNLVNKDQLDILATLRESVNEDKAGLEADVERLQLQIRELKDKNKMQLEQVNSLLMEKVTLQSESIGQRGKMLERERDFGDLRASVSGKDLPGDAKARMLSLHEENVQLKEQLKTAKENLAKAKQFIKSQDKLFKDEMKAKEHLTAAASLEEADDSLRSQLKILEEDLARQKRLLKECEQRYRQEQQLMLSVVHDMGTKTTRSLLANQKQKRPGPSSWLGQQRRAIGQGLTR